VQFLTESKFVIEATVLAHVAAPSYIAARGRPRTPEDLKNHDCIGFTGYVGWPDWPLAKAGKRKTVRPQAQIITDNSEVALDAATAGGGITFTADWLAGPAMRDGKLVEVLPGGGGKGEGGDYAVLPPGNLVPAKTRLFVDEVSRSIKAGWST
jgi:DNA-binding transcriptional LysR family regulator